MVSMYILSQYGGQVEAVNQGKNGKHIILF